MSYKQLVFDAEGGLASDELAFKDFGTSTIPGDVSSSSGRISPSTGLGGGNSGSSSDAHARLYEPDLAMQNQIGRAGIGSSSSGGGWFSLDSYSTWFDVDTNTVLYRSYSSMIPKEDYLSVTLNNTPDLYGPFWLPTTLIFALFLSSSLSTSIQAYLAGVAYNYDFTRLSVAVSVVYTYALAVPIGFWAVMRYWAGVSERGPVDIVSVYGYSTTVWIFAALLAIPPIGILRFGFSVLSFLLSGFFLLRNIYPILSSAQYKAARVLILAVAFLHFVFAMVLWFYFLNPSEIGSNPLTPTPNTPINVPDSGAGIPAGAGDSSPLR